MTFNIVKAKGEFKLTSVVLHRLIKTFFPELSLVLMQTPGSGVTTLTSDWLGSGVAFPNSPPAFSLACHTNDKQEILVLFALSKERKVFIKLEA